MDLLSTWELSAEVPELEVPSTLRVPLMLAARSKVGMWADLALATSKVAISRAS